MFQDILFENKSQLSKFPKNGKVCLFLARLMLNIPVLKLRHSWVQKF